MSEEIVIKSDVVEDAPVQVDEMAKTKASVIEAINQADGVLVFCFKKTETEINGQKVVVAKSMFDGVGCSGGGDLNLPFICGKANQLLQNFNVQQNANQARLAE